MRRLTLALLLAASVPLVRAQQPFPHYTVPASAVSSALAARSIALPADRIRLTTAVPSATPDPTLHLLALDLQPDGALAARLSCQHPGECRPFFAVLLPADHAQAAAILQNFRDSTSAAASADTLTHTGVTIGTLVTLRLSDRQMRIQLQGIAIDAATPGHEIRVASLDRRHTWRGVVVDASTVEGDLP